jgi:transketolase
VIGMTMAHRRLADIDAHVWVLCGDSELAEGSVWEAIEHAGAAGMAGMTVLVDVNRLGQTGETRHGWDVGAYERRFAAFGWNTSSSTATTSTRSTAPSTSPGVPAHRPP